MGDTVVVSVAVDQSVYQIDRPFDYIVPDFLKKDAVPGCRVLVPFGKGNTKKTGLILKFTEYDTGTVYKFIIGVLDKKPLISEKMLAVAEFIREQTFCTWYNAIRVLLPPGINYKIVTEYKLSDNADVLLEGQPQNIARIYDYLKKSRLPMQKERIYADCGYNDDCGLIEKAVNAGIVIKCGNAVRGVGDASMKMIRATDAINHLSEIKLTPKQKLAASVLFEIGCCSVKELEYFTGLSSAIINGLQKKGIAVIFEQEYYRNPYLNAKAEVTTEIKLTDCQQKAYKTLEKAMFDNNPATALLFGVTGSGKTQVFLKLCEKEIESGKSVIVMVPEISLTPQTLGIFHKRFGGKVAVFHSAMSQGERLDEWKRTKNGDAVIAVGTRSAVFAPFENLGLIIMDEEHEHTYKSEMSPRFHARDVAKYRIAQNNGLLVLSSATPSVESYSMAMAGKYILCKLNSRYGNATLPTVDVVDTRKEVVSGKTSIVSNKLYDYISGALSKKQQCILLLNRRGYNTYISCPSCGYVINCDNCSISMTYHSANNRLMCHYCGKSIPFADKCPNCGCDRVKYSGIGTQKAEDELKSLFPEAKILRMDADSTVTRSDYENKLKSFADGEYDILLGTQMVAKGLDFPKTTVVGILNSDSAMHSSDFRSFERTFSLLTQVIGRSGRGKYPGVAVIQTSDPDNKLIELAAKQDYETFYNSEILTRKLMTYPPYCDIATVCFSGLERKLAEDSAFFFLNSLKNAVSTEYKDVKLIILGPTAAAVPKVNSCYRFKLIIKYKNSKEFRNMIIFLLAEFLKSGYSRKTQIYVDVNPDSII